MPLPKEERYTMADAASWDEHELSELINGVPLMMSPPSRVHQEIVTELTRQLANYLQGKPCRVYPAPFAVRLFEKTGDAMEQVDTMVEPDLSIICDPNKLDDAGCKGAPDLVLEVLSPSTQRRDRLTKFNLYQQAGVREYWIVDPDSRTVQVYTLDAGRYQVVEVYTAQDVAKVNVLEDCSVNLSQVFKE